jgi:CRP/FNR family transcriptional regulator, anaerobic regulatory protein
MSHDLLFSSIEKHVTLDSADKTEIEKCFTSRNIRKGQFLVHQGSVDYKQIFIVSGSVITYFIDLEGNEHTIQFGIEGWWIGDFQSYIFQKPATCNVLALENTQVLEASYENIQKLYAAAPKFERYHRIITQYGYASFQQRILQNLSMSAEERYTEFHKKYPKVELRFPQKIIASYLGMSPEFYSKVKKKVNDEDKLRMS